MNIISNKQNLATTKGRADALEIVEAGLSAIDTTAVLKAACSITGDVLTINNHEVVLGDYERIYIIGFGKVACSAAYTLEKILAGRVKEGAVIGIKEKVCDAVDTYVGTHPLPSSLNYTATKHIEEVAHKATENDLVLVIVSGGGSALLCSSMGECDQSTRLFGTFLPSGGTIEELNLVRKHLSHLKGGGLAKALYPSSVISLVFSDVPGGDLASVASGPTYKDATTIADAQAVIDRYGLGEFTLTETPKDEKYFANVTNIPMVTNRTALIAMLNKAVSLGYNSTIFDAELYAKPEEVATILDKFSTKNTALCIGGETKLSIPNQCTGKGGRNDALALMVAETLRPGQTFVSIASDGHDNTEAAGAIVDGATIARGKQAGLTIADHRECFDSYPYFHAIGDHILTGPLESNVSDLMLLLEQPDSEESVIEDITVEVIEDSRGKATIEVTVLAGGHAGRFSVPSGASTGAREVAVVNPNDAAAIVREKVLPVLHGVLVTDQSAIDKHLHTIDGTDTFSAIGGNVALGVSVAACKAAASCRGLALHDYIAQLFGEVAQAPAPYLFVNLINGGKHATHGSAVQEHQIIPQTNDVHEALRVVADVQRALWQQLVSAYGAKAVTEGDEGGFVIPDSDPMASFRHVQAAVLAHDYGVPVRLGADIAAGSFYNTDEERYVLQEKSYTTEEFLTWYTTLHTTFPELALVEDPLQEDDFAAFAAYHQQFPEITVIGDDLTTTNRQQLERAVHEQAIDAIIIKPNQIGTLSDTLETMRLAYSVNCKCIISHRSGETMDDFIADLAAGTGAYGLKAGAPTAPHRAVKYGRLRTIFS